MWAVKGHCTGFNVRLEPHSNVSFDMNVIAVPVEMCFESEKKCIAITKHR